MANSRPSSLWDRLLHAGVALLLGEEAPPADIPAKRRSKESSERTIHRVRQTFDTSCGVAATAMLARVSHDDALAVIFPSGVPRKSYRTNYPEIRRALDHFKVPHGKKAIRVSAWDKIPTTALVKIRWTLGGESDLHWVIFQRKSASEWRLLDPDAHDPSTLLLKPADYEHFQPLSYLEVTPRTPQHAVKSTADKAKPTRAKRKRSPKRAKASSLAHSLQRTRL